MLAAVFSVRHGRRAVFGLGLGSRALSGLRFGDAEFLLLSSDRAGVAEDQGVANFRPRHGLTLHRGLLLRVYDTGPHPRHT